MNETKDEQKDETSAKPAPTVTVLVIQDICHKSLLHVGPLKTDQQIYEAVKRENRRRGER